MKTILIVDDSKTILNYFSMLSKSFSQKDYKFIFVESYEKAVIEILRNPEIKQVISDYKLGKDNGIELLKIAKKNNIHSRILITAVSKPMELDESCTFAIRKPITEEDFKKIVFDTIEEEKKNLNYKFF